MIVVLLIVIGLLLPVVEKGIKKHAGIWYLASIGLSALSLAGLVWWLEMPGYKLVREIFGKGALATTLFIYVMLAPVLPTGKKLTKAIYHVRGELAIMAAFLILPHNIYFGRTYFVRLLSDPLSLSGPVLAAALCSVAMLILLVPLTVTSFKKVRKRMKAKNWKRLQRFSYLFYGLLYVHVMLVLYPHLRGSIPYLVKAAVYTIIFGMYGTLRVKKFLNSKKSSHLIQRSWRTAGVLITIIICGFLAAAAQPEKEEQAGISETSEAGQDKTPESPEISTEIDADQTEEVSTETERTSSTNPESPAATETERTSSTNLESSATTETERMSSTNPESSAATETEPTAPSKTESPATTETEPSASPENELLESASSWKDGTWQGEGNGYLGKVKVEITVEQGKITQVKIVSNSDDQDFFSGAAAVLTKKIVEQQSTEIDTVSGATYSSEGILEAVADALANAE